MSDDPNPEGGAAVPAHYRMNLPTILRRRCPECGQGPVFSATWTMNTRCPVCGLVFGRGEPGYFTGAMYVSYGLAVPLIALLTLVEYQFLPHWSLLKLVGLASLVC